MPFRHIALYRWADHVDDDHLARLAEELDSLAGRVEQIRFVSHGRDAGIAAGAFDYSIVVDVDDLAAWRTARDHPAVVVLTEELLTGHVADQAVTHVHVRDGADPDAAFDPSELTDDELLERARRAARSGMDALLAEPDDTY